jgi:hypothetical protein
MSYPAGAFFHKSIAAKMALATIIATRPNSTSRSPNATRRSEPEVMAIDGAALSGGSGDVGEA